MKSLAVGVMAVAGLAAASNGQIIFQEIGRVSLLNQFASANNPGIGNSINGVAWNGTDLYVAGFRNGGSNTNTGILRVNNALVTGNANTAVFGSFATISGRGYNGLALRGNTLLASYDSGSNDANGLAAYNLDATNTLRWNAGSSALGNVRGFAGPGFNPGAGGAGGLGSGASFVVLGSNFERTLNLADGTGNASPSGFNNGVIAGPLGTTGNSGTNTTISTNIRDIDFNPVTGDAYLRVNGNVVRVNRNADGTYAPGTMIRSVVGLNTNYNAIANNVQFLNTNAYGDLVIFNDRRLTSPGQEFGVNTVINTNGVLQNVQFLGTDGVSPFVAAGTTFGAANYDFSWDAASQTLAISDATQNTVYIFAVPSPAGAALLGLGGLMVARRRR